ncbi:MAG TPA: YihY/virulence factor BrkB family protein [Chitinophagaceae bacterium]
MSFLSVRQFGRILRTALRELKNNDPLRLAAATAFFTTFALPAIIIIFVQLFGLIIDPKTFSEHLFEHLAVILGQKSVDQIKETLSGFRQVASNWFITIAGFAFLVFVATTLFKVIRDSLNQLWGIKLHHGSGMRFSLVGRLKSVAVILIAGLLFLATLLAEALQALLLDYIQELWKGSVSLLYFILNQVISIVVVSTWFTMVFRFLGNAKPTWKVAFAGGLFTGILFTIGKLLLGWLLGFSNIHNIYGASGSFVLLLLFVFYSSFILYFGGTFTNAWAEYIKQPIAPGKNAYRYDLIERKLES